MVVQLEELLKNKDMRDSMIVRNCKRWKDGYTENSVSFLKLQSVQLINKLISDKIKQLSGAPGDLIYLNEPVLFGNYFINRLGKGNIFYSNSHIPIDWMSLDGGVLIKILKRIKNNEFFIYRKIVSNGREQFLKTWLNASRKFPSPAGA